MVNLDVILATGRGVDLY